MKLLYRWKNEGVAARIGSSIWPGKKMNEKRRKMGADICGKPGKNDTLKRQSK
ncbi:hypothetical protein [Flavonifractor sp. An91]|uniref:hypothetical protein n=1 Tax=Flavonifractor sp. An91 TaxID=1965665 RepID=UPI0013A649F5|nr:hypothetical protein [Flavonifractor sp. An91]